MRVDWNLNSELKCCRHNYPTRCQLQQMSMKEILRAFSLLAHDDDDDGDDDVDGYDDMY